MVSEPCGGCFVSGNNFCKLSANLVTQTVQDAGIGEGSAVETELDRVGGRCDLHQLGIVVNLHIHLLRKGATFFIL